VKTCVIVNPKAGSVKDLDLLLKQIDRLAPALIHVTPKKGAAKTLAAQAIRQGCDYIVAAGGDGTLNEVVNGFANRANKVRIGLLPLGTGNDFARCLNLPTGIEENIDILIAGATTPVDLIRVKSTRTRFFVNVSAGGFSGLVNEKLTRKIKKNWGPLAYLRSAAAALPELRAYRTTIRFGPRETVALDLYNVIVANGRFVAGGLPIAPESDPSDGLLDVILIPERPAAEIALLTAKILLGKHLHDDLVTFRRVPKVSIKSNPGMWFNVDGELVGNAPVEFEIVPGALQFVVGKE
jgi:diacylglycerol kinase (ATP)